MSEDFIIDEEGSEKKANTRTNNNKITCVFIRQHSGSTN